ncbi:hypothetical protein [Paenibacillus kobensis]|uniref:hypothetical protein n=1 Tax=Paenibacillus kobensis TaxID=59841 RepID=UPI000FD99EE6|nr:hypothetical protein [Paenibacillus kobensis]
MDYVYLRSKIQDALLNPPGSDEPKKRILLEKRLRSALVLIYSEQPEAEDSSRVSIDMLQWIDFNGDTLIGTGLVQRSKHQRGRQQN